MAKRKEIENLPDTSKQYYELLKQGYEVYPTYNNFKWWIEYKYKGEVTRFTKPVAQGEITSAINKTILHLHNKLTNDN
jgi:hypothetical protein